MKSAAPPGWAAPTCSRAFGQGDVEFENRAIILIVQRDVYLFAIDRNVLADDIDDFLLELRQIVRLVTLASLVGNNDLQALLGDRRGRRLLAIAEIIENAH
eukprot:TRINITY_DN9444_c0_g1_i1.p2 TRINITY_DN9444_c0_g1~~TRINITY_DN9444_c0_g1_i1.p2  ORF type:complete len:101 (-),score=8.28 TRINITY_DN9444_c0_g1_i1:459-761(-)